MSSDKKLLSEEQTQSYGLLSKIENGKKSKNNNKDELETIKYNKYMVIQIGEKKYALFADEIREIVGDVPMFYVPFVPPYIRGFINRHGEPYTVLDLTVIFERENLDSSNYLILGREDDQLALLISDVIEIKRLPDSELHKITSVVPEDDYFLGSISIKENEEIFVLNLDQVLKKLEGDLNGF